MDAFQYTDKDNPDDYPYRSLDPLEIYQTRAAVNKAKAAGVERLVYKLFGSDVIGSLAFAIDPLAKFRIIDQGDQSPLRKRLGVYKNARINSWHRLDKNRTRANYKLPGPSDYGPLIGDWVVVQNSTGNSYAQNQYFIPEFSIDTVNRNRTKGTLGGPFEKFKYDILSPTFYVSKREYSTNSFPPQYGGFGQRAESDTRRTYTESPYAAISLADQKKFLLDLQNQAQFQLEDNVFRLLARCIPTAAPFDIFRAIGELKDFKDLGFTVASFRSVDDILKYIKELKELLYKLKQQPDLFLTLNFGIAPLLSDIEAVIRLPARISAKVNLLLSRNGKATTFRTKSPCAPWSYSPPGFAFDYTGVLDSYKSSNTFSHEAELRMAVSANFEFNPIETPKVRDDLTRQLTGGAPSFTALYNLMPWTWLLDWFTGFGDYISVIEKINNDRSLINNGYMTYSCKGSISGIQTAKFTNTSSIWERPSAVANNNVTTTKITTAQFNYSYQKRVRMSSLGVKSTAGVQNLSGFQQLIIGSLIGQRLFRK